MKFLFTHPCWFALAQLPFRKRVQPLPPVSLEPICGQAALPHVPAGRCAMDYMGCEMIALYNALLFAGRPQSLGHIIQMFERRRWLLLGGRWGADPYAIGRYLREEGIPFSEYSGKNRFSAFDDAINAPKNRIFVLSYWLGDTVFSGAHAVALVRREDHLWAYNLFNTQTGPVAVDALWEILTARRLIVGYCLGGITHEA